MKTLLLILMILSVGCASLPVTAPNHVPSNTWWCQLWRECLYEDYLLRNRELWTAPNKYRNQCLERKLANPQEPLRYMPEDLTWLKCGMEAANYFDNLTNINQLKREGKMQ